MFFNFYGLRENPFGVVADKRFLYLSPTHNNALNALYHGLSNGQELLALVAPPGMGKTTVVRRLAAQLEVRVVFLSLTNSGTRELIACLLASLGVDATDRDLLWMHERLNEALRNEAKSAHRFVLIIDEAQNLTSSTLEALRLLSNYETPSDKLIQIVLVGQPSLADALERPEHVQLRQRLSVVARLEPLPAEEVTKYIDLRLRVAGYAGGSLFTSGACRVIANYSCGIPRRINSICFNAMSIAHAAEKRQIDTRIARKAVGALDLGRLTSDVQSTPVPRLLASFDRTQWVAFASSLLVVLALVGSFSYVKGLRQWVAAGTTSTSRRDSVTRSPIASTTLVLPDSSRSGRDFVELPRVVPPTAGAPEEPSSESTRPSASGLDRADKQPPADVPKESKTVSASATASRSSAMDGDRSAQHKVEADLKRGEKYMRLGKYAQALSAFQAASQSDPDNLELRGKIRDARSAKETEARVLQ